MADSVTPNLDFILPEVGFSKDTWGEKLNTNWTEADLEITARMRRDMLTFDGNPDEFTGTVTVTLGNWSDMIQLKNTGAPDTVWPLIGSNATGHIQMSHGDDPTSVAARIDPNGTALSSGNSVVTKEKLAAYMEAMNPVGTIHMSASSANPSTYFGFGTWIAHAEGRALVGVGTADGETWTVNETQGTARHLLTTNQIPSHSHNVDAPLQSFNTNEKGSNHTHDTNPPSTTSGNQSTSHDHDLALKYVYMKEGSDGTVYKSLVDPSGTGTSITLNSGNQSASHTHNTNLGTTTSTTASDTHNHSVDVNLSAFDSGTKGGGSDHNNIQPSIGIYVWRRTA